MVCIFMMRLACIFLVMAFDTSLISLCHVDICLLFMQLCWFGVSWVLEAHH